MRRRSCLLTAVPHNAQRDGRSSDPKAPACGGVALLGANQTASSRACIADAWRACVMRAAAYKTPANTMLLNSATTTSV